eukprot:843878_1
MTAIQMPIQSSTAESFQTSSTGAMPQTREGTHVMNLNENNHPHQPQQVTHRDASANSRRRRHGARVQDSSAFVAHESHVSPTDDCAASPNARVNNPHPAPHTKQVPLPQVDDMSPSSVVSQQSGSDEDRYDDNSFDDSEPQANNSRGSQRVLDTNNNGDQNKFANIKIKTRESLLFPPNNLVKMNSPHDAQKNNNRASMDSDKLKDKNIDNSDSGSAFNEKHKDSSFKLQSISLFLILFILQVTPSVAFNGVFTQISKLSAADGA